MNIKIINFNEKENYQAEKLQVNNPMHAFSYPSYPNKDSFRKEANVNFSARPTVREMSAYIELKNYDKFERFHAGWQDSVKKIREIVTQHCSAPVIIEHGAGTGNSTELFAQIPGASIQAVEIDSSCYLKLRRNTAGIPNVKPVHKSSLDYEPKEKADAVVAMFSLTHLNERQMKRFLTRCKQKLLKENGIIVIGDEFLPRHNPKSKTSRIKALASHHNNVIAKAILDGKPELARLELDAMISGYQKQGDFKVTCPELEKRLRDAGFEFQKTKIYPNKKDFALSKQAGTGVYVYVAKLKEPKKL